MRRRRRAPVDGDGGSTALPYWALTCAWLFASKNTQLLAFPQWDALLVGLAAGEDEDTLYVVPEGVGEPQHDHCDAHDHC